MQNQAFIFIVFILVGFLIGIIFDIFRILRKSFKTPDIITNLEDISFWIISGLIILYSLFKFNNGILRFYVFLGLLIGFFIYILLFSKIFIKINVAIIKFFKNVVNILIIKPIHLITKLIIKFFFKPINFICINISHSLSNIGNKILKKVKINNKNKESKKDFT